MAHPNIDERRYYVACLLNSNTELTPILKKEIANKFNCHVSAIYADLKHFQKHGWHAEISYKNLSNDWLANEIDEQDTRIYTPDQFRQGLLEYSYDDRVLKYLEANPKEMHSLSPRQFEEFVAELLTRFGYKTNLGPKGADKGIDIYANKIGDFGPELILVQCKRYKHDKKVGRPVFQQLNANIHDNNASGGLVVTTSSFTQPAIDYVSQSKYRLKKADKHTLESWLNHAIT